MENTYLLRFLLNFRQNFFIENTEIAIVSSVSNYIPLYLLECIENSEVPRGVFAIDTKFNLLLIPVEIADKPTCVLSN